MSDETKLKLSESLKGRFTAPKSDETKARMKIAAKSREETKRLRRLAAIQQSENQDLPAP